MNVYIIFDVGNWMEREYTIHDLTQRLDECEQLVKGVDLNKGMDFEDYCRKNPAIVSRQDLLDMWRLGRKLTRFNLALEGIFGDGLYDEEKAREMHRYMTRVNNGLAQGQRALQMWQQDTPGYIEQLVTSERLPSFISSRLEGTVQGAQRRRGEMMRDVMASGLYGRAAWALEIGTREIVDVTKVLVGVSESPLHVEPQDLHYTWNLTRSLTNHFGMDNGELYMGVSNGLIEV